MLNSFSFENFFPRVGLGTSFLGRGFQSTKKAVEDREDFLFFAGFDSRVGLNIAFFLFCLNIELDS